MNSVNIKQAAKELHDHLDDPMAFSVGIGDGVLYIYRHDRRRREPDIQEWQGYPVHNKYVGRITPATA